ncbi:MAG: hypothetical protein QHJ73_19465, partial [Armatimonadota bacterium]|nr:hypothetical protein [Armatimonadota bacterium]
METREEGAFSSAAPPQPAMAARLAAVVHSNTSRQFRRYSVVGALGFIIDMGLYTVLTRTSPFWARHYLAAHAVSFTCA